MQGSQKHLDCLKKNLENFICRFVTTDKTWVHYFTPESKNKLTVKTMDAH